MSDKRYNGWTNYETWCVSLWLGNEEGSCTYWNETAQELYDESAAKPNWTRKEVASLELADRLKESITEGNPLSNADMYTDLLNGALSDVNWMEIANHFLDDIEEEVIEDEEESDDE